MIHFRLKHIDECQPAGTDGDLSMSWFWLTDGELWIELAGTTLYEYTPEAREYFGNQMTSFNEYPLVRFIEDFTELFKQISEPIPDDIYAITDNLENFFNDTTKWLNINDTDEDGYNHFFFEEYDQLISFTYNRNFDSGHLIGGPHFSFFRNHDKIRIVWNVEFQLENGIDLWTAKNNSIEIPYSDFIYMVQDFGKRFFDKMETQVELAVKKDWEGIQIDKNRLIEEHKEREVNFWRQFSLLENVPQNETNWNHVRELKSRMEKEIKTNT